MNAANMTVVIARVIKYRHDIIPGDPQVTYETAPPLSCVLLIDTANAKQTQKQI
jgi:hypothetical protein